MKKRIIAIACMAAIWMNVTAVRAENIVENLDLAEVIVEEKNLENYSAGQSEIAVQTNKSKLDQLIDQVKRCSPEGVATEESLQELENALSEAERVSQDQNADENAVVQAYLTLMEACENMQYAAEESRIGTEYTTEKEGTAYSDGEKNVYSLYVRKTDPSADIFYDFGIKKYLTGVNVYTQYKYNSKMARQYAQSVTVSISQDGEVYQEVAAKDIDTAYDEEKGKEYCVETQVAFPAAYARYVRVTVFGGQPAGEVAIVASYGISEIEVNGFSDPFSKENLLKTLQECYLDGGDAYTEESYKVYQLAYEAAFRACYDGSVSGKAVLEARTRLVNAYSALKNKTDVYILTQNYSASTYPDMQKDIITGITYQHDASINGQLASTDPNCTNLLDGTYTGITSGICFGHFGTGRAVVDFDMSEDVYLSGADVWEFVGDNPKNTHVKTVEILVSNDGVDFKSVSTTDAAHNLETIEPKTSFNISQDFEAVKCRYVRIEATTDSYQIDLNEVVLKGFRIKGQQKDCATAGLLSYQTANGADVLSLENQQEIVVSGSITSHFEENKTAAIITAVYQGNDIISWSCTKADLGAGSRVTFANTVDLKGETDVQIYTFVWDGFGTGISLSKDTLFGSLQ